MKLGPRWVLSAIIATTLALTSCATADPDPLTGTSSASGAATTVDDLSDLDLSGINADLFDDTDAGKKFGAEEVAQAVQQVINLQYVGATDPAMYSLPGFNADRMAALFEGNINGSAMTSAITYAKFLDAQWDKKWSKQDYGDGASSLYEDVLADNSANAVIATLALAPWGMYVKNDPRFQRPDDVQQTIKFNWAAPTVKVKNDDTYGKVLTVRAPTDALYFYKGEHLPGKDSSALQRDIVWTMIPNPDPTVAIPWLITHLNKGTSAVVPYDSADWEKDHP